METRRSLRAKKQNPVEKENKNGNIKGNEKNNKKKTTEIINSGINVSRKKAEENKPIKNKNVIKPRIVLRKQTNSIDAVNFSEYDEKEKVSELKNKNNNKIIDKSIKSNKSKDDIKEAGDAKKDPKTDPKKGIIHFNKNGNNNLKENQTIINRSIKRRLSQLLDRLKKEKLFECLNDISDYSEIFIDNKEKQRNEKDVETGKCIDASIIKKINVDIIHSKLHYEMYKDENEFNNDILLLFDNAINIIKSEKNKKEKINLYKMRKNAFKNYQTEFHKLLISTRGTKEAKNILLSFNEYYEKDEKYFSKIFENGDEKINNEVNVMDNISDIVKIKEKDNIDYIKDGSNKKRSSFLRLKLKLDNIKIEELNNVETDNKHSAHLTLKQKEKESIHIDELEVEKDIKNNDKNREEKCNNVNSNLVIKKTVHNQINKSENKRIINQWENILKNNILKILKNDSNSVYFKIPVLNDRNINEQIKKEYKLKIEKPMDYTTVSNNLLNGIYKNPNEIYNDIKLIFKNCLDFNPDITPNKYIINAAKNSDDKFENLWNKWKNKIYDSYYDMNNKIFNINNYVDYFKKKKIKNKKYTSIYSIWINYLINNKIDIIEFCKIRNIDIHKLNENTTCPINIEKLNLIDFKNTTEENNLCFFIFKEEYKNIYGKNPPSCFMKNVDDKEKCNYEYIDNCEEKLKREAENKKIKISLKSNLKERTDFPDEIKKKKQIYPKILNKWKEIYNNVIYFYENIFDNYLENKKSYMIKCENNTFLTNCFYFKNVLENLEEFINIPEIDGKTDIKCNDKIKDSFGNTYIKEINDVGLVENDVRLNACEDVVNIQNVKVTIERNKRKFEKHPCISISLKRKKSKEMHIPICQEFQTGSDSTDFGEGEKLTELNKSDKMDELNKSDKMDELNKSDKMVESVLFNINNRNFYNFHGLFDKMSNFNEKLFLKKEKTILINLNLNYSAIDSPSYSPINNTYFYNYNFDNNFFFFIKSSFKLNLYIKIKRKNIYINNENYVEHLKIQLINKCKQNKQIKLYISNNSPTRNNNNLIYFLEKAFNDFHTQNLPNNSMRVHYSANKVSELISQIQMYIKKIDALLRIDNDKETNITTINILKKKTF